MLPRAWFASRVQNVRAADPDVAFCLAWVVEKDTVTDDVGFPFCEVAALAKKDEGATISDTRRDEERENDGGEKRDQALNWNSRLALCR